MVRLWLQWRGSMGRAGYCPEAGGMMDQCAAMMEAFEIMDGAKAELLPTGND